MIELQNIHKVYPMGKQQVHALRGVTTKVDRGEFLVLKGPSGSGKSTLLNLIGLLDIPTEGSLTIYGRNVVQSPRRERTWFRKQYIGFVFQNFNLIPELTVYENVEIPLLIKKERKGKEKILSILDAVGLSTHLHHKPYELSGGQQQRVAIARALVKDPLIVLADEPTANLDSHTGEEILKLMRRLNESLGTTFIVASHDALVISYARRILTLRDGELLEDTCQGERGNK
ncbi:MAG TPA: ABC transporter ATP-binding protein [Termitinemataceae bacterium]|nr:ABC transporter ATP-binding protein [Termitinemataceae bacterium]HOM23613.1 ABC transporter ATP-binding protein [Termitinemataceae bacterium]HPP99713.1 ABC transporter ATP-binding protein [Termitinemataceae bacterium]